MSSNNDELVFNAEISESDKMLGDINNILNEIAADSTQKTPTKRDFARAAAHRHRLHHRTKEQKKQHRRKTLVKVLIIILCVLLAILLLLAGTWFYLYKSGENDLRPNSEASMNIDSSDVRDIEDNGKTIEYKGKKYVFNENITSILFLGIDRDTLGNDDGIVGTGGQADSVYLLSLDTSNGKYNVISISRDTLCDIGVYSANGEYIGIEKKQLCLSYAYGDGKASSCENSVRAVSTLMYNIPINSYFSLERSAIPKLNDLIGGVTVPEFDENGNDTGNKITLIGNDAYDYIHYRDISKLDSNNVRMKRQMAYLKAFADKFISATKQDLGLPLSFYNTTADYSCTNITASSVTYLATKIFANGGNIDLQFNNIKGTVKEADDGYAVYIVDKDALTDLVISTYYTEVK